MEHSQDGAAPVPGTALAAVPSLPAPAPWDMPSSTPGSAAQKLGAVTAGGEARRQQNLLYSSTESEGCPSPSSGSPPG